MNKLLAAALVLSAAPLFAQVEVPAEGMAAMNASMKSYKERLAPAAVDRKAVDTLFNRLAKAPEGGFTKVTGPDKDGVAEVLAIELHEVEPPAARGEEDGPAAVDLVYRRYFTDMTATSQTIIPQKDGRTAIDEWVYVLGLGGAIESVTHNVMIGKMKGSANLDVDKKRSRSVKMPPNDPAVMRRWKAMEKQLLLMGPTLEA